MVKLCSPFVFSGVADSSFKWSGRRPCQSIKADQTHDVRSSWISSAPLTSLAGGLTFEKARRQSLSSHANDLSLRNQQRFLLIESRSECIEHGRLKLKGG